MRKSRLPLVTCDKLFLRINIFLSHGKLTFNIFLLLPISIFCAYSYLKYFQMFRKFMIDTDRIEYDFSRIYNCYLSIFAVEKILCVIRAQNCLLPSISCWPRCPRPTIAYLVQQTYVLRSSNTNYYFSISSVEPTTTLQNHSLVKKCFLKIV